MVFRIDYQIHCAEGYVVVVHSLLGILDLELRIFLHIASPFERIDERGHMYLLAYMGPHLIPEFFLRFCIHQMTALSFAMVIFTASETASESYWIFANVIKMGIVWVILACFRITACHNVFLMLCWDLVQK